MIPSVPKLVYVSYYFILQMHCLYMYIIYIYYMSHYMHHTFISVIEVIMHHLLKGILKLSHLTIYPSLSK